MAEEVADVMEFREDAVEGREIAVFTFSSGGGSDSEARGSMKL